MTAPDARRLAEMHALYRMFDEHGQLLYIGITGNLTKRIAEHEIKRWYTLVASIKVEWFPHQAAARSAEKRAIGSERPRYNIADRKPPTPERMPPPGGSVTLREAVKIGLLGMTLQAARKARTRDPRFPASTGRIGVAELYDQVQLAAWARARKDRHLFLADDHSMSA